MHDIIKIRAVQELSASQAVGFLFPLKEAVRSELGTAVTDSRFSRELAELEGQIDRIALAAFDMYVHCREQINELRVNEMKRQVSWVVERLNGRGRSRDGVGPGASTSTAMNERREDPE